METDPRSRRAGLWALVGALLLPIVGVALGEAIMLRPIGDALTTVLIVLAGTMVGLALSRVGLPTAIVAAALVQHGLMAALLFARQAVADVDGSAATYLRFPWILAIELVYMVIFLLPGLLARIVLRLVTRARPAALPE